MISDFQKPHPGPHIKTIAKYIVHSIHVYDKRDDSDFNIIIVDFRFLDGDVPRRPSFGVYISHLICFARATSHVGEFNCRNKFLTAKLI